MQKEMYLQYFLIILLSASQWKCSRPKSMDAMPPAQQTSIDAPLAVGAAQTAQYLPLLENKKVAMVVNQTSQINGTHLVDSLLAMGIYVTQVFAPEHGFRGKADAGETIKDGKDAQTGLPIVSLYGKNKKPSPAMLKDIDIVVFDIQDVGARFYTYISTMHYVMEACAEANISVLILDRPNPTGHYIDGPIREDKYKSFVGMHPIPIVHGLTVGELAQMINGEKWLKDGLQCDLHIIPCLHYNKQQPYHLPVKPSPNLPNPIAIQLYPSLCLFEGTTVSVGRGTNKQFQVLGHPDYSQGDYTFTPVSMPGAKYPKHQDKMCRGYDLSTIQEEEIYAKRQIQLEYLIDFYTNFPDKEAFFNANNFIDKLAGTALLRQQIVAGKSAQEIRDSWQEDLQQYDNMRQQYLIYK